MRVLILGGAGFLGSRLAPRFAAMGHEVALCDDFSGSFKYRSPVEYRLFIANAAQYNPLYPVFRSFRPEIVVVALAHGNTKDSIYNFYDDIRLVVDTATTISALLDGGVQRVYFCSSGEVYGPPQPRTPVKETRVIGVSATHHGAAKLAAEQLLTLRCVELGIPLTVLRIFDMFGPRIVFSPRTDVINFALSAALRRDQIGLRGPDKLHDFIYVDDVVAAIEVVVAAGLTGVVNIGSGQGTSLRQVCAWVEDVVGAGVPPMPVPDRRLPTLSLVADTSVLSSLGWAPQASVVSVLPDLLAFRQAEQARSADTAGVLAAQRGML